MEASRAEIDPRLTVREACDGDRIALDVPAGRHAGEDLRPVRPAVERAEDALAVLRRVDRVVIRRVELDVGGSAEDERKTGRRAVQERERLAAVGALHHAAAVIAVSADPVGAGLVGSLAHPGGNTTGLSLLAPETDEKTFELLKETLPRTKRVAIIFDPNNPGMMLRIKRLMAAAPKVAVELQSIPALNSHDLGVALAAAAKDAPDALIVLSPIYAAYRNEVVEFATKARVPLSFDTRGLAREPNALLSYGVDISALFRRAATFVDRILKGAKPGNLPVEQPTKFEFVINLKTARMLGLTVPPSLLARADEVIE